ncbi:MAG: helix-turn-helix transcriptional regulator [Kribbellaceae bacterium]
MDDVPWNPVPLIGRTTEIATLLSAIDEANGRRAGAVLLSGDAGVGKTRLLDEVATGAQQRGFTVLAGHCSDFGDAGLPYLPFTEIFGRLANDEPALVEELERTFRPITRLLPTQRLIGAEQSGADGMIDRGALFDAMLGALTRIAAKAPVLLVVEDVHWADESTRDLLGYLLTRLADQRFVVLASYRSDDLHRRHPLRRPIAEWSRLPRVRRLALAPLDTDETRALIGSLHPDPLPERDVQRILDRAGGNAFFTEELVAATSMGDPCAVPPELADLLLIRLDAVSEDAANVARVAAVAGRRVSHPLLSAVAELPDRELDAALRELIDAHVLELQGSGYGFRHALLAEAVYDDLLPGERVRLHASYAAAVRSQMVPGTAAELARHATRSHDLATAFDARVRAAEEALTVAAPQEALLHYEKAIELFPNRPPDSDVDRLWLMTAAAHAAALAAQQHRALKLLRRALSELDDDAAPEDRASVLATLARIGLETDEDAEAYEATTEAIKLVPEDPPSPLRARVASLHAQTSMVMGRYADATHWANHSLDIARSLGSATAVADATTTLAILRRKAGDPDAALRALTEAAEQARTTGETGAEMRSRYLLGSTHYEQGRIDEAQKAFAAAWRRAQEVGRHWAAYGLDARWMLAISQFVGGDWDASLRTTQVGDEPLPATVQAVLDTARLSVRAGRGDPTALEDAERLRDWWKREPMIAVVSAGPTIDLYLQRNRPLDALAAIDDIVAAASEGWQNTWFMARIRLSALGLAALCQHVVTEPESARPQWVARGNDLAEAGRTTAEKGVPGTGKLGVEAVAWLARLEAEWDRLRWLADVDPPPAGSLVAGWERAVEVFGYGDVYEQARSRVRLAAVLRATGRTTDAAAQAALAEETARRLGAKPLLAELSAGGDLSSAPAALTARETEVLTLLVAGRTNRQLARQLYISEKTVSVHVSNILAKLGVRSRTEAAAVARRDNLV